VSGQLTKFAISERFI